MKTDSGIHLKLVPKQISDLSNSVVKEEESFEKTLFSLIEARATGRISSSTVDALVLALQQSKSPQTIIQRSLEVAILVLNSEGDASVCFKYDVANFGRKSLSSRAHKFWFSQPQTNVEISASTDSGVPLEIEEIESSYCRRDINVHFPKSLEPADQMAYRIQYLLKGEFLRKCSFEVSARMLTSKITMSVLAPKNTLLNDGTVTLESGDSYFSDCPPEPIISNEFGRAKLSWQYTRARTGDQFLTRWTLE